MTCVGENILENGFEDLGKSASCWRQRAVLVAGGASVTWGASFTKKWKIVGRRGGRKVETGCIALERKHTRYGHYDFLVFHSFHHFAPFSVDFLALSYWLGVGIENHMFGISLWGHSTTYCHNATSHCHYYWWY